MRTITSIASRDRNRDASPCLALATAAVLGCAGAGMRDDGGDAGAGDTETGASPESAGTDAGEGTTGSATTAGADDTAEPGVWTRLDDDPATYALGWTEMRWVPSMGRLVVFYGNSGQPGGDNSVRMIDPFAPSGMQWGYYWPNEYASGLDVGQSIWAEQKDNHPAFLVRRPDQGGRYELHVWEGTGSASFGIMDLERLADLGPVDPGDLDLAKHEPKVLVRTRGNSVGDREGNFAEYKLGLIQEVDAYTFSETASHRWSRKHDCGIRFGGQKGNGLLMILPNTSGGSEPYELRTVDDMPAFDGSDASKATTGVTPPKNKNSLNNMVTPHEGAHADYFWYYGGSVDLWKNPDGSTRPEGERYDVAYTGLWKLDIVSLQADPEYPEWTWVSDNPIAGETLVAGGNNLVVYDSDHDAILVIDDQRVNRYRIDDDEWDDLTPPDASMEFDIAAGDWVPGFGAVVRRTGHRKLEVFAPPP